MEQLVWTQPNYDTSGPAFEKAKAIFEGADVPTEDRTVVVNPFTYRKYEHAMKMDRKKRQRREAGDRRAATYERAKFLAPLTVRRERKRLKSPYAFRRGGL